MLPVVHQVLGCLVPTERLPEEEQGEAAASGRWRQEAGRAAGWAASGLTTYIEPCLVWA